MRVHTSRRRTTLAAILAGAALLFSACSSPDDGAVPESLAFAAPGDACPGDIVVAPDVNLAEGVVESAGPFAVSIPAGTYEVRMSSWADMDDPVEPNERWFFTADSGYTSPIIADPGDNHVIVQSFTDQVITSPISSITLQHMLPGDSVNNSVVAKCISFTLTSAPETTTTTAAPTTTTTAAPTTTTTVDQGVLDTATSTTTTSTTTTTTTTTIAVAAAAPEQPQTLALTGPSDLAASLALVGGALTLAGFAALAAGRRAEDELEA